MYKAKFWIRWKYDIYTTSTCLIYIIVYTVQSLPFIAANIYVHVHVLCSVNQPQNRYVLCWDVMWCDVMQTYSECAFSIHFIKLNGFVCWYPYTHLSLSLSTLFHNFYTTQYIHIVDVYERVCDAVIIISISITISIIHFFNALSFARISRSRFNPLIHTVYRSHSRLTQLV